MKSKTTYFALCGLFCALLALSSKIQIPTALIPFTLQTACFLLCILILPKFYCAITVAIYLLAGLIGLPLFAHGGGFSYLFNPSFGYLLGFLVASLIKPFVTYFNNRSYKNLLLLCLASVAIVHLVGSCYTWFILRANTATEITLFQAFLSYDLPFIPLDVCWALICPLIAKRLLKTINL